MRTLKYNQAISEATVQAMEADPSIFLTGIAVDYPSGIFGTTWDAFQRFGKERVFESPAMENASMGIALGAAAMGKRPIIVHPRNDFMFLAFDQLINLGAKWNYMYNGNAGSVPVVIRCIVGKGWGQGATHSQSLHAVLAHFPGLNVLTPTFPCDAKGLLLCALKDSRPTIIIEHRSLYNLEGDVSEEMETTPIGKAVVAREGADITIVSISYMTVEALHAADELAKHGISAEIIDVRSIRPLDTETIIASVRKTGRLIVADTSWSLCGISGEIIAQVSEKAFTALKTPPRRLTVADCPAPVSRPLEEAFYPKASTIVHAVTHILSRSLDVGAFDMLDDFTGPY